LKLFCKSVIVSFFFFLIVPDISNAQVKLENQPFQFRIWTGYSFQSVYFLGKTTNATSIISGIGLRRAIRSYDSGALVYYTADLIPYIYFDYPKRDDNDRYNQLSGFGFSPVGFLLEKKLNKYFTYQVSISGSFIFMEEKFPTDKGRKLNYTFDPSFTIQTRISSSIRIASGYKFHHISNAQTGSENPGLDSNFLYISLIIK
jgi:hypothetical protein